MALIKANKQSVEESVAVTYSCLLLVSSVPHFYLCLYVIMGFRDNTYKSL